jgi:DNA-binding XRE family transcriptional regulator
MKLSLKAARVNAGYSQKQASKELKISNKTLCSWENGRSVPNAHYVGKLCDLYGVSYDNLNFLPTNPL